MGHIHDHLACERGHGLSETASESIGQSSTASTSRGRPGAHQSVGNDCALISDARFLTVDMLGLVLRVLVTAASVTEREGAKLRSNRQQMAKGILVAHHLGQMDGEPFMQGDTYDGSCKWWCARSKPKGLLRCLKKNAARATFGWFRRLVRDYEGLPGNPETFIYLAMIRLW